ncbi:MAG TPA: hypothetical protein VGG41_00890 [Solirubrobacteraceae bacterium]
MAKNALFSSYRAGENRVTASMLAVFERIDIGVVERLLAAATGESALPFVSFANQIAAKAGSVPDASISASFRYLFEVKTVRDALGRRQLEQHLDHLDGGFAHERLFVLTPDPAEPSLITQLGDSRLTWLNFHGLDQAIDEILHDETELLAEQTRFLLYELRSLFSQERLISQEDAVVVAARNAYPEYLRTASYVCQAGRAFREGIDYMGFYYRGAIQPQIARIRARRDNVVFSAAAAQELATGEDSLDREIARLVSDLLQTSQRSEGELYQVFLLSEHDSDGTLRLPSEIKNTKTDRNGKPWAWTMNQAYTHTNALTTGPLTTSELDELSG